MTQPEICIIVIPPPSIFANSLIQAYNYGSVRHKSRLCWEWVAVQERGADHEHAG